MPEKERILIQKTLAGDPNAFGDLVEHYGALVYGLVLEIVRRPDEVEDLCQDVFFKAYQKLASLRDPNKFAPWLGRIASRVAVDWLHQKKVERAALEQASTLNLYVLRADEKTETGEMLWQALDRLPPEYRRAIVLFYIEGCPQRNIARFLGVSLATVKWRLYHGRKALRQDIEAMLYEGIAARPVSERPLREKVLAGLPALALFQPPRPTGWIWGRRILVLGTAGLLGVVGWGTDLYERVQNGMSSASDGIRVRYEPLPVPVVSIMWTPLRPGKGEKVLFSVAGEEWAGDEAYLHYITDVEYPRDRVVALEWVDDVWQAELAVTADAAALFFYVSTEDKSQSFPRRVSRTAWKKKLRRYDQQLSIHDERRVPVRGAAYAQAQMADLNDLTPREIAAHIERELEHYPDHYQAHRMRWNLRLRAAGDRVAQVRAQVVAEKRALRQRFADDPDAYWCTAELGEVETYREIYRRFPASGRADEAAYYETMAYIFNDDLVSQHDARREILERFIRTFPHNPYIGEVYGDLLDLLRNIDPERAKTLADSLIDGKIFLDRDPLVAEKRSGTRGIRDGYLAQAKAYVLRFDLYQEEGDEAGALNLAERLLTIGPKDPLPYIRIGTELVGDETTRTLGLQLLQAGLPWTKARHMMTLPGFAAYAGVPDHVRPEIEKDDMEAAHFWRWSCLMALGKGYLAEGESTTAAAYLDAAANLQSRRRRARDSENYLLLGQAHEQMGNWAAAEAAYLQVLEVFHSHPQAERALEDLHLRRYGHTALLRQRLETVFVPAPEFRVADMRGERLELKDLARRPVLIYYDGAGSIVDAVALEQLIKWGNEYMAAGLAVLYISPHQTAWRRGISYKNEDRLLEATAEGLVGQVQFLVDERDELYDRYGLSGNALLLIDRAGRLRLFQQRMPWTEGADLHLVDKIEELLGEHI